MSPASLARALAAAALPIALACGGGGGGGGTHFTDPGHQDSADSADKLSGIGDSIMQGMDASGSSFGDVEDQPSNSFAQGTSGSVFSLYSRYRSFGALPHGKEFESVSGSTMLDDAHDQAVQICNQTTLPNRVVVLLGANDICDSPSAADFPSTSDFGAALANALDDLGTCLQTGSWVHVLSIPRIDLLYAAVTDKQESLFHESCPQFWSDEDICPVAVSEPGLVGDQVVAYDDTIGGEVDAADLAYQASNGVHFTTDWTGGMGISIGTYAFTADDVSSLDCFHPSKKGQALLACGAWESWEGTVGASACFQP